MSRNETLRWTKKDAAREFVLQVKVLTARLAGADILAGHDGKYSTRQICAAVFGDIDSEKLRMVREQADRIALSNQIRRGELLSADEIVNGLGRALSAVKSKVQGETRLDQKIRDEICIELHAAFLAASGGGNGADSAGAVTTTAVNGESVGREVSEAVAGICGDAGSI